MNSTLKALLSPRFMLVNREAAKTKCDSDVKAGDITIMSPTVDTVDSGKKVHMRVVKEDASLTAKFYTDSDMSFCFGSLSVSKCSISFSSSDLTKIEIIKRGDDRSPSPGLLIKARSEEDAMKWLEAMSSSASDYQEPVKTP